MPDRSSLIATGGWPFILTAAIGRLPSAMIQLGLLMYVSGVGLGLSLGGLAVAAVGLGTALGSTVLGRLVDSHGPLLVVIGATVVQVCAMGGIWLITPGLVSATLGSWALLLLAAVAGFANPQIGPIVRSRWSRLSRELDDPRLVRDALGYEGAMDELSFIVGPVIAGLLVAGLGPTPAICSLMLCTSLGQGIFIGYLAVNRDSWGPVAARGGKGTAVPIGQLLAPMTLLVVVGVCFGATQTALSAVNEARGTEYLTGIIYGCVGVGSALSSLLVPRLPAKWTYRSRLFSGICVVILGALGFAALPGVGLAITLALLTGGAVGVILVTGFSQAEKIAPPGRIAYVMTMLSMCLTLGVSLGAASSGQLVGELWRGFLPVMLAGLIGLVAAARVPASSKPERS